MTGGFSRWVRRDGDSAGERDARSGTRRHFLTAAVGMGFGYAAGRYGDTGSAGPTSRTGGGTATATVADHDRARDAEGSRSPAVAPVIGANLNGRPHRLGSDLELIDASDTRWVRAFLDVRDKLANGIHPDDDPDVAALRRASRTRDCNLIVSLKWDFSANWGDKEPRRVPDPGSNDDRELRRCAARYLASIGAVDVVVLGNEPMWETLDADITVEDPPIVRFTRAVKDHLVRHGDHGDPTYLVGAFNRVHNDATRERFAHFYRRAFDLVRGDEDIDGVDLHLHYRAFAEAEAAVAVAREAVPDGMITATEFSPVWRYDRHVDTPIDEFEAGERFARAHDLPAGTTAVDYFERAKRNPRPPAEVAAFYDAMPWYNVNHIEDMYALFAAFGVSVGTLGLVQDRRMRTEDWTTDWLPFHINFLFQPALMRTESGVAHTAHPHYVDDYRDRAVRDDAPTTADVGRGHPHSPLSGPDAGRPGTRGV